MCDFTCFQEDFLSRAGRDAVGPMAVYSNTIASGAIDALKSNYPVIQALLGGEMFEAMALDYLADCPPRSPILAMYGDRLSDWLAEQQWAGELPYLPDVARIERLFLRSFFAADDDAIAAADLHSVDDWQLFQVRLHPSVQFDWLRTPAMSIWLHHQSDPSLPLDPEWVAEGALFVRRGLEVVPFRIDRSMHRFLCGLRLGESVGDAALKCAALYPDTNPGELLSVLLSAGAFAACSSRRN